MIQPEGQNRARNTAFVTALVIGGAIVFHALFPRYEMGEGALRLDRWTGEICFVVCYAATGCKCQS